MQVTITDNEQQKIAGILNQQDKGNCPVRDVLDRIGDKWSIYVILELGNQDIMRFGELKSKIIGVSQKMLTVTLRSLEQDGFVERTVYAEVPPRVEYKLTALGKSLLKQMITLSGWAEKNMEEILSNRKAYEGEK